MGFFIALDLDNPLNFIPALIPASSKDRKNADLLF